MKGSVNINLTEIITDAHLRENAFELSDSEKVSKIEYHFSEIMETLGIDLEDDSLKGTPKRVAKMFVKEIFSGLNPKNKPDISLFENKYDYKKCWSKRILLSILIVSIIMYRLLARCT
jgi:GTP cyclohydrolase I